MKASRASATDSAVNFYTGALRAHDVGQTKRCKAPEEQGCGRRKPLEEFGARTRYRADGSKRLAYDNWCLVCQRRRARKNQAAVYERKKLPPIRYAWCGSKKRYRIYMYNETVHTVATEDEAKEAVAELKARDRIYNLFFRLAAPELVWCPDTQDMVER